MDIDRKFLPIYQDATILLRPKTGLKDMFLELDPGTQAAGEYEEGDTIPVANTAPDVNLDEVLAAARHRHPRLPAAAAHRRRRGARRARQGPRRAARQPRPDQPRARQAQPRGRQAQGEPRQPDPQHEHLLRPARRGGRGDRRPDRLLELGAGRDRGAGPRRPAGDQAARADPAGDPRRPRRDERARRRARADPGQACGRSPAGSRPVNVSLGRTRPRDLSRRSRTRSGPSSRSPASRSATCARPPQNLVRRDAPPDRGRQQAQQALQHGRLQPGRRIGLPDAPDLHRWPATRATRATSTGSAGSATSATAPSRTRTRTASTAASTWPPTQRGDLRDLARTTRLRAEIAGFDQIATELGAARLRRRARGRCKSKHHQ